MDSTAAYEEGLRTLGALWSASGGGGAEPSVELRAKIANVLSDASLVSQRYALVTQLLIKSVMPDTDARALQGFGDDDFSARSFAKYTVSAFAPITRRLGNSTDPYVSNPLRRERLLDDLEQGRGALIWEQLLSILDTVNDQPDLTEPVLRHAISVVQGLSESDPAPRFRPKNPSVPTDLSALQASVGIDEDLLLDIIEVLESDQPQVILAGPPGTSKTYTAQALASYLTDADPGRITTIQFHASYGYEDFVEGLRPVASEGGSLSFEVKEGALLRVAAAVARESDERRVLILDEMNRANLPRVFGELLFAIERRGQPIDLLYTRDFSLPGQICFIGTMNTADRNIRSIDAALRRRFMIFELQPSPQVLTAFYGDHDNEVPDLVEGLITLNDQLTQLLDRHHTIGHTYFMDERGMNAGRLNQVWLRQIRPLLEEYLFDMPDELARFSVEAFWPSIGS